MSLRSIERKYCKRATAARQYILILFWCAGFLFGCRISNDYSNSFFFLMRGLPMAPVSIVGLLLSRILSVLILAISVWLNYRSVLYIFVFIRALTLCCVSLLVLRAFGDAGWLMRYLLLFSGSILAVGELYLALRGIAAASGFRISLIVYALVMFAISIVDLFCIRPFVAGLY